MTSAVLQMLVMLIVFFTCCTARREKKRSKAASKNEGYPPVDSTATASAPRKKRFGMF